MRHIHKRGPTSGHSRLLAGLRGRVMSKICGDVHIGCHNRRVFEQRVASPCAQCDCFYGARGLPRYPHSGRCRWQQLGDDACKPPEGGGLRESSKSTDTCAWRRAFDNWPGIDNAETMSKDVRDTVSDDIRVGVHSQKCAVRADQAAQQCTLVAVLGYRRHSSQQQRMVREQQVGVGLNCLINGIGDDIDGKVNRVNRVVEPANGEA